MLISKTKLTAFVKGYKYSTALCILLFVLALIFRICYFDSYFFIDEDDERKYSLFFSIKHLFYAFYNTFILFSGILIFCKTFLRIPAAIVLAFLLSFDVGLLCFYKAPMNSGIVASIFETNTIEAFSVFRQVFFVCLPLFALCCFLAVKSSGEIRKRLKRSVLVPLLCVAVIVIGLFIIPFFTTRVADEKKDVVFIVENIKSSSFIAYYADKIPLKYPLVTGSVFLAAAYFEELAQIEALRESRKALPGVTLEAALSKNIAKIVVVAGESALREHHSLYGYPVATTPFLDSLSVAGKGYLSYYERVISPACYTREALRLTMSYAVPSNVEPFLKNRTLVDIAKNAGYRTYWISNQDESGSTESVMRLLANTSDSCIFMKRCFGCTLDDLTLIPQLASVLKEKEQQFVVVHLEGSHADYEKRYDSEDTSALGSSGKTIDYDKTIHHTDRVLRELYRIARSFDENVLIYYYSDHGELIGKSLEGHTGHGVNYKYKAQYHIPLVILQNRPFVCADSVVNKYYDEQTNCLNVLNNIFILGELMGYQTADSLIEKAKADGRYVRQADGKHILYDNIKD